MLREYVKHSYPQIIIRADRIKTDTMQNKICFKLLEPMFRGKFEK
jgi:hypothetical protein